MVNNVPFNPEFNLFEAAFNKSLAESVSPTLMIKEELATIDKILNGELNRWSELAISDFIGLNYIYQFFYDIDIVKLNRMMVRGARESWSNQLGNVDEKELERAKKLISGLYKLKEHLFQLREEYTKEKKPLPKLVWIDKNWDVRHDGDIGYIFKALNGVMIEEMDLLDFLKVFDRTSEVVVKPNWIECKEQGTEALTNLCIFLNLLVDKYKVIGPNPGFLTAAVNSFLINGHGMITLREGQEKPSGIITDGSLRSWKSQVKNKIKEDIKVSTAIGRATNWMESLIPQKFKEGKHLPAKKKST